MVILGVASASDFAGLPQLLKSGWKNSDNFLQEWDKKNRILWVTLFEVPLCGHGTLAASAALQKFGNENRSGPQRVQTQVLFKSHLFTQDIIWTLKNGDFVDFKLKLRFYCMSTTDHSGLNSLCKNIQNLTLIIIFQPWHWFWSSKCHSSACRWRINTVTFP